MVRLLALLLLALSLVPIAEAADSTEKVALLEAAIAGDVESRYQLGELYKMEALEGGDFLDPDMELVNKAVYWFEQASDQGHSGAQSSLLSIYRLFSEKLGSEEKFLPLVKKMADEGAKPAQLLLSGFYKDGYRVERDRDLAAFWLEKVLEGYTVDFVIKRDKEELQCMLADLYMEEPNTEQQINEAFELYLQAANAGHFKAKVKTAECFEAGVGTAQDKQKAFQWYLEAAQDKKHQNNRLYYKVGMAYTDGEMTQEDPAEAFRWVAMAFRAESVEALHRIGHFYFDGYGVEQDKKTAFNIYVSAAEKGSLESAVHAADMLADGVDVEQKVKDAAEFYQYAAQKGHAEAQAKFGVIRSHLAKSHKDYRAAYFWVQLAALGKYGLKPELVQALREKLSSEEQAELELQAKGAFALEEHSY